MSETVTSKCETCGSPADFEGAKKCANCWEIERRLSLYLKSEKGKDFVNSLTKAEKPSVQVDRVFQLKRAARHVCALYGGDDFYHALCRLATLIGYPGYEYVED